MPASTMPMMWGMRSLLMTMGASKIISSTTKNIIVGLLINGAVANKTAISGTKV